MSGEIKDLADGAGLTRFGLTKRWNPDLPAEFFTTMPTPDALALAKSAYRTGWWVPMEGDFLTSDIVAAPLFSFSVNEGVATAVSLLQAVLGFETKDGIMGPVTLAKANSVDPSELAKGLRAAQKVHYASIAAANPSKQKFLQGWLHRVDCPFNG